jgi:CRISPR-associated protein Csx10
MRYLIVVEALSPLAMPRDRSDMNYRGSNDYITGSIFRGSLAGWYLREIGTPEDQFFKEVFIKEACWFGPLYPVRRASCSRAIPRTARTCKRVPGFKASDEGHGVADALLALAGQELGNEKDLDEMELCPVCQMEVRQPLAGFMEIEDLGIWHRISVSKKMITRTSVNNRLGKAEDGTLHSFEVINEGQRFAGVIEVADEWAGECEKTFLKQGLEFHTGRAKSRGLGSVGIQTVTRFDPENDLPDRIKGLNATVQKRGLARENAIYFTITLETETIIKDLFFRSMGSLQPDYLGRILNLPEQSLTLLKQVVDVNLIPGWNYIQGLPREDALGITKGSVFLYQAVNVGGDELVLKLQGLENNGIGYRRAEGFGRISVCDCFHWEGEER